MTEAITDAIRQARRSGGTLALLLMDLDRFKQINDSLGHAVGDRVLLDCADRLKGCLRQGDVVARMAGDQFALLVHETDSRGAEATARRVLDTVSHPCSVEGMQFTLTCSMGVALFPSDGRDAEQLVRHAESALQRAKQGGRGCFRFHEAHQDADMRQRMRLDHAMRQALASQRFRLHYQPQIDLRTGNVVGAEALIRWRDPELGEVSPGQFIPVAEESGFIIAIGDWVLEQAVRQAARWRDAGFAMPVSVNVSALQFQQADFIDRVAAVLREHKLAGALLELELTESILVHDANDALARLSQLSQLGVRLAIDDFGTGYSSLAYLKRFPIDRLKIDRSFVKGLPSDESDAAIVRAIVQLAQALAMTVIAEGVETEPQRAFLLELGCNEFQGFLYAPALDALSFEERVRPVPRGNGRPRLRLVVR
jgi:diguanylate cyclase (GGDEF)-like protein